MNIFIPLFYEGYNWKSQVVCELSAIDAPTRSLWVALGVIYALLVAAFGWGVLASAAQKRPLRIAGILLILNGLFGLAWSPMHQREVLAAGGGTFSDTWHIVMSVITVLLMFLSIGFGSAAFGRGFRIYSIATILVFIVFGILTFKEGPNVAKNLATPFIGLWESINIAAFVVWLMVFAVTLLDKKKYSSGRPGVYARTDQRPGRPADKTETMHKAKWLP